VAEVDTAAGLATVAPVQAYVYPLPDKSGVADRVTEPFKQTDEADDVAAMEGAGLIMIVNGTFTDSQPLPGEATFTRMLKS
jgi:hypothetical protein